MVNFSFYHTAWLRAIRAKPSEPRRVQRFKEKVGPQTAGLSLQYSASKTIQSLGATGPIAEYRGRRGKGSLTESKHKGTAKAPKEQ